MDTHRKTALIAGALIIAGFLTGILSIASAIDSPDYLEEASENADGVVHAGVFQFSMAVVYLGIALTLYPLLKKYNKSLALGFLCFRLIAVVCILIGVVILLLILALSQEYVNAGNPDLAYYQFMGELLRTGRDLMNHVAMIISLSIGSIMFYIVLFQSKLTPRWLAGWGILGAALAIVASVLVMYKRIDIITPDYILMNVPMAVQELVLAGWLLVKGFDKKALNLANKKSQRMLTVAPLPGC